MKKSVQFVVAIMSIFYTSSSLAADCSRTYVNDAALERMIDAKFGDGASNQCRWNRNIGGSGSFDQLFARVDCKDEQFQTTFYVVGNNSGSLFSNESCVVSIEGGDQSFQVGSSTNRANVKHYREGEVNTVGSRNGGVKIKVRPVQSSNGIYCVVVKGEPVCLDLSGSK